MEQVTLGVGQTSAQAYTHGSGDLHTGTVHRPLAPCQPLAAHLSVTYHQNTWLQHHLSPECPCGAAPHCSRMPPLSAPHLTLSGHSCSPAAPPPWGSTPVSAILPALRKSLLVRGPPAPPTPQPPKGHILLGQATEPNTQSQTTISVDCSSNTFLSLEPSPHPPPRRSWGASWQGAETHSLKVLTCRLRCTLGGTQPNPGDQVLGSMEWPATEAILSWGSGVGPRRGPQGHVQSSSA